LDSFNTRYWDVYFDLMKKIKLTFDQKGISIPFPSRTFIFFKKKPAPRPKLQH